MLCHRLETRLGSRHFFTHPYLLLKPEGRMSLPAGFDKTNSLSLGRRNEVLLFRCFSMESCCKTQERLKVKAQFSPPLQPFSIFKMEKQLKSLGFSWDRCPRPELALCWLWWELLHSQFDGSYSIVHPFALALRLSKHTSCCRLSISYPT